MRFAGPPLVVLLTLGTVYGIEALAGGGLFECPEIFTGVALLAGTWTLVVPVLMASAAGAVFWVLWELVV